MNDEIFRFVQELHNNQYLSGQWSVDVMKDGDNYYIIDLALMNQSALIDLLPKYPYIPNK